MTNEQILQLLDIVWRVVAGAAMFFYKPSRVDRQYYLTETHASINALDERIRLLETEVARKGDVQFVAKAD